MASSLLSSETQKSKILILKSFEGDKFEIEESAAVQSVIIKNMVEEGYTLIPLSNVNTKTLVQIIDYLKKHDQKMNLNEEEIKNFDEEFVKKSLHDLFELVSTAHYLDIYSLKDMLCQAIADRIKNKSVNAVRKIFNVPNDFTPEEETTIRREHPWVHEGEVDESVE